MKKTILFQVFTAISLLLIGSISMNAQNFRNDLHDLTTAIDKDKSQSEPLFTPFVYVRQVANVRQDIGMSRYNELKIDKTSLREIQKRKTRNHDHEFSGFQWHDNQTEINEE